MLFIQFVNKYKAKKIIIVTDAINHILFFTYNYVNYHCDSIQAQM